MDKWVGKIAVVTGASAGIGVAIVKDLANAGVNVVCFARRLEKMLEVQAQLKNARGKVYVHVCDVSDLKSIQSAFQWVFDNLGGVDILINNAGVVKNVKLFQSDDNTTDELAKVIDTNFTGLVYCAREAVRSMIDRGGYGHVINMNSICGHQVTFSESGIPPQNVYPGTKHAVTATTEAMRQELIHMNNLKIRFTVKLNIHK